MAQSPRDALSHSLPNAQRKTFFLPAPGKLGKVVETGPIERATTRRFEGPEAALRWCIAHRVNLVYFFNDAPVTN
jgi:hypothetical protein